EREELSVLGPLRADRVRQGSAQILVRRVRAVAAARVLPRVEDAEADAVVVEVGLGDAVHSAVERAVGAACELAAPPETQGARLVQRLEGDAETIGCGVDLEARDLRRNRAPARVPNGEEQTANGLDAADAHVPQVDPG